MVCCMHVAAACGSCHGTAYMCTKTTTRPLFATAGFQEDFNRREKWLSHTYIHIHMCSQSLLVAISLFHKRQQLRQRYFWFGHPPPLSIYVVATNAGRHTQRHPFATVFSVVSSGANVGQACGEQSRGIWQKLKKKTKRNNNTNIKTKQKTKTKRKADIFS